MGKGKREKQIIIGSFSVVKETERAYLLRYKGGSKDVFGGLFYAEEDEEFWVPKSAVMEIGVGYVIAKWWKTRTGDPVLDIDKWPGREVVISIDPQVRDYEGLLRMGDYKTILFKRALEREHPLPVEWSRQGAIKIFFPASLVEKLREED